ncbi:MAG: hypothetical protein M3Z08_17990 [Chloroflexota bacterium]|nr:hypothetical protein [Chloroflexota bacterium]
MKAWGPLSFHRQLSISVTMFLLLALSLVACGGGTTGSGTTPTATSGSSTTAIATSGIATPTTAPGVKLGTQPCPNAVQAPAYWDSFVGVTPQTSVAKVECANLIGSPSLQALVTVVYNGTGRIIDVYVFDKITDPSPKQIFKLLGLYAGDAKISAYNTVLTAEVDNNSTINKNVSNAGLQRDLFREFKWSDQLTTLVPVAFPAFFPDLTRYQAELDQGQVNQGQQAWKLSATQTAQMFVASDHFLKWGPNATATIVSGGGAHDASAVVNVKGGHPGGSVQVSMSRLEGNTNGGIWEITSATSNGMSIGAPAANSLQSSPVSVSGSGTAFEGKIGAVSVLDHLYNDIGHANASGANGNGHTTFSSNITYHSDFQGGAQEGIIVLYSFSQADGSIAGVVAVKVLLGK